MSDTETVAPPLMVLCVPGPWADALELGRALAMQTTGQGGGWLFAGRVLLRIESHWSCELEFGPADARMVRAFHAAGPHWRGTPEMEAIAGHRAVAYLVGPGGSREAAEGLMQAAAALLRAGGLGVKVESSGIAHPPAQWLEWCDELFLFLAHRALVVYVSGDGETRSCGMHNLGLPDAVTEGHGQLPADLLRDFTHYLFTEAPVIRKGQTFAAAAEAPLYRLHSARGDVYEDDSLFNNPYGAWRLSAVSHE